VEADRGKQRHEKYTSERLYDDLRKALEENQNNLMDQLRYQASQENFQKDEGKNNEAKEVANSFGRKQGELMGDLETIETMVNADGITVHIDTFPFFTS
jgi:hypothetical protein